MVVGTGSPSRSWIDYLREFSKPRDLKLAPEECYLHFKVQEFEEYSTRRQWVSGWLKYVKWCYGTALSPDVTIDDFFNAPVVSNDFLVRSTDPNLVRFGLMWKLFDMIALHNRAPSKVGILTPGRYSGEGFWLLGGVDGTEFLVWSVDLTQSRAGNGDSSILTSPTIDHRV